MALVIAGFGLTLIDPVADVWLQLPVVVTIKLKGPLAVAVPLIVYFPLLKLPETPAGKPVTVAFVPPPPTVYSILLIAVPLQTVWLPMPLFL